MARRSSKKSSTAETDTPPARASTNASCVLPLLGLHGLEAIEPVLLAALATAEPLLLIGVHGSGKSLLLTRVAEALGLSFRHYNASLLNFDDLVGFPLPGKDGALEYVRTPAAIWGAGAVIFDEISRCRPDIQNKLFPIIHERRVQGLLLEDLKFRWGAMNPPASDETDGGYLGSEPLDAALADRFAYVVEMPAWDTFSEADQLAIIRAEDVPVTAEAATLIERRLALVRSTLPAVRTSLGPELAVYVRAVAALLAQAGLVLSPRRAGMLHRNVAAVHAAALAADATADPGDSAWLALKHALPQRAEGEPVPEGKVWAAHREAWRLAGVEAGDPLAAVLLTSDPLERLRLATAATTLARSDLSIIVADVLAQLRPGQRDASVVYLFESGAAGRLSAAVAEQAAERYGCIASVFEFSEATDSASGRHQAWQKLKNLLSQLDPRKPRDHLCANALATAFASKELASPEDLQRAFEDYQRTDVLLRGAAA